jgi:transposase
MSLPPPVCSGCRQRDHEITKLKAEVAKLRQDLDKVQQEQHRQAGRFRRRHLKKRRKKPGRRDGHRADLRPTPTAEQIDRVLDVPCQQCPDCQAPLVDTNTVVQYQTDLPPIVPIVTQFNIQTGYCSRCQRYCQGRHPEQTSDAIGAAGNTFGPVVLTMAAELKHRLGVPYRKICDFFSTYCALDICPATFVRAEQRLAELAQPTFQLLLEALRQCHVVHADETGWRVGRLSAWLWVFSSKDITIYVIRHSRGHDVPEEILGDFDGFLVVDGLRTYDVLEVAKGQCNGHLLRRCKELKETVAPPEQTLLHRLMTLLQDAIALAQRRAELKPETYARRVQQIEASLDDWLDGLPRDMSPELDRLDTHIRRHRGEWLVFLHDPEVPPTNNHAERMLRPAVITRKVGGCNKTLQGALVHGILASLMATCRQQAKRFLDLARCLWQSTTSQAIPVSSLPGSG